MQFYLLPNSFKECGLTYFCSRLFCVRFCGMSLRLVMSHHKTGWNFFVLKIPSTEHIKIASALWDGRSAWMHTHIYNILSYAQSHVKYNIHIQEVQKRGYFVFGIAHATAKREVNAPE